MMLYFNFINNIYIFFCNFSSETFDLQLPSNKCVTNNIYYIIFFIDIR